IGDLCAEEIDELCAAVSGAKALGEVLERAEERRSDELVLEHALSLERAPMTFPRSSTPTSNVPPRPFERPTTASTSSVSLTWLLNSTSKDLPRAIKSSALTNEPLMRAGRPHLARVLHRLDPPDGTPNLRPRKRREAVSGRLWFPGCRRRGGWG